MGWAETRAVDAGAGAGLAVTGWSERASGAEMISTSESESIA